MLNNLWYLLYYLLTPTHSFIRRVWFDACEKGVLVPVRIMRHNDAGVRVRLEGGPGLFGFVPADYVTDDVLPPDPITGQVHTLHNVIHY